MCAAMQSVQTIVAHFRSHSKSLRMNANNVVDTMTLNEGEGSVRAMWQDPDGSASQGG